MMDLERALESLAIRPTAGQLASLRSYADELLRWNARINLTAARDVNDAASHVVDCCALVREIPIDCSRLIDVGSGGGLPAAMIAILRPSVSVTALEPVRKKLAFLQTIARSIPNLEPLPDRVEDHPRRDYDVATSRATFAMDRWLAIGASLVRAGGTVLGMEGAEQAILPAGAERRPYALGDRTRAIIVYSP